MIDFLETGILCGIHLGMELLDVERLWNVKAEIRPHEPVPARTHCTVGPVLLTLGSNSTRIVGITVGLSDVGINERELKISDRIRTKLDGFFYEMPPENVAQRLKDSGIAFRQESSGTKWDDLRIDFVTPSNVHAICWITDVESGLTDIEINLPLSPDLSLA